MLVAILSTGTGLEACTTSPYHHILPHSSKGGHLATQRMPLPLLFKGYCSKLSIKLKIQDSAPRALGGPKGCRCIFLVIYKYVKVNLYMWIKVMA